jgi:hypothetical protein
MNEVVIARAIALVFARLGRLRARGSAFFADAIEVAGVRRRRDEIKFGSALPSGLHVEPPRDCNQPCWAQIRTRFALENVAILNACPWRTENRVSI